MTDRRPLLRHSLFTTKSRCNTVANNPRKNIAPVQAATSAPLIERSIERATGIVYNITGGRDLTLQEVNRRAAVLLARSHGQD